MTRHYGVITGLSAHVKVDGAFVRVDGENDYIYYALNLKI